MAFFYFSGLTIYFSYNGCLFMFRSRKWSSNSGHCFSDKLVPAFSALSMSRAFRTEGSSNEVFAFYRLLPWA